jgi:hypothetical protein
MAWPNFSDLGGAQVANQVAAPAVTRTPNLHRATKSLIESADGRMATVATRLGRRSDEQTRTIDLTPTGLLMEGHYTFRPGVGFCTPEFWSIPLPPHTGHCSNNRVSPSIPTTLAPRPLSLRVTPSPRQVTQSPKARHRSAKLDGLPASASLVRHSFISFREIGFFPSFDMASCQGSPCLCTGCTSSERV